MKRMRNIREGVWGKGLVHRYFENWLFDKEETKNKTKSEKEDEWEEDI